ncbi:MAG: IclR family transcriptional regulator [Thermomicrobiales bacterium]|nr:IclR family transcriptional regulator [Thermomicrobiales bacterium]
MVQVIDRTLDILELISSSSDDVSVSELHVALGLPVGTVHRLLSMLVKREYVTRDPRARRYSPGPKLLEIGSRALSNQRFDLQRIVQPHLAALTAETGETSNLVVPQGTDIVYLAQVPSRHLIRMFTEVGQRAPLYCTGGGRAILSGFTAQQVDDYLRTLQPKPWTPRTLTSREALRASIIEAQNRGFAIDDEERELGVRCVAAPIFDRTGACVAALTISGPATRMTLEEVERIGPVVRQAADECSAQLGHSVPQRSLPHSANLDAPAGQVPVPAS